MFTKLAVAIVNIVPLWFLAFLRLTPRRWRGANGPASIGP